MRVAGRPTETKRDGGEMDTVVVRSITPQLDPCGHIRPTGTRSIPIPFVPYGQPCEIHTVSAAAPHRPLGTATSRNYRLMQLYRQGTRRQALTSEAYLVAMV